MHQTRNVSMSVIFMSVGVECDSLLCLVCRDAMDLDGYTTVTCGKTKFAEQQENHEHM